MMKKVIHGCREAVLMNLQEFISRQARVARSRFGRILCPVERNTTGKERPFPAKEPWRKEFVMRGAIHANRTKYFESISEICPICKQAHPLKNFIEFNGIEVTKRWDVVEGKRLCFGCLEPGHQARHYDKQENCEMNR